MNTNELSKILLDLCGGPNNILQAENCMTRLRVILKDGKLANLEEIKKTEGVLGLAGKDKDIQIIIGPGKVNKVAKIFQDKIGTSKKSKSSVLKKFSQIFVPLIPGIMAAGLLIGVTSILDVLINNNIIQNNDFINTTKIMFNLIANGCLSFLAIYVGINSAKVFGCSKILGGIIGGIILLDAVNDFSIAVSNLNLFNFIPNLYNFEQPADSILCVGKGGVIGVVVGVWVLSKIENFLHKHVPEFLDIIIVPFISVICAGFVMLLIIMPLVGMLASGIISCLDFLGNSNLIVVKIIYGFILGATFLPMVMLGLHQSLIPIYFLQLDQVGFISMIGPQMMAGGANIGAAIIVYFKAKQLGHKKLQRIIGGSIPTAVLGIHEPLIYGMTLPIAILFIPIAIGGGVGAAYCVLTNVLASSYGPATLLGVTTMQPESMLNYLIGLVISCLVTMLFTQFIVTKDKIKSHMEAMED